MVGYLVRRCIRLVVSLVVVSIIPFGLLQMVPGSFGELSQLASGSGLGGTDTAEAAAQLEERYGEGTPAWRQYLTFMQGAVTGDMGPSYKYPQLTVEQIIADAFPVSLTLAALATALTLVIAVPIGVLAALRKDTFADYGSMFTLTTIQALPGYLFALVLILIFAAGLGWLPTSGWSGPQNLIIPVIALAVQPTAMLARYVRSSMLEALREEYVVAAYAKGGTPGAVTIRHALRNSLIPVVTVVGPIFAALATGTVFIEALMGIPGLGMFFTVAARSRDVPLLMGTTLFFALIIMVLNLLVDLLYGVLDPRIRHERTTGRRRRRGKQEPEGEGHTTPATLAGGLEVRA
ncbi:ABC transporter permease [Phytoactinopolyspora limicola]|uniref:ABC transporter permease n=1 Tax=Phytoactinopolyspora limicola TaxID=2715536 RepID=UPI001407937D|nr:ABC transporter permease [Phytoactinopolyspora limicola]